MIISITAFLAHVRLDMSTLEFWMEEQWLAPRESEGERTFTEADVARALLIRDLTEDLGVNTEGVGVVLHLLDQVHGLRRALGEALKVAENPPA